MTVMKAATLQNSPSAKFILPNMSARSMATRIKLKNSLSPILIFEP